MMDFVPTTRVFSVEDRLDVAIEAILKKIAMAIDEQVQAEESKQVAEQQQRDARAIETALRDELDALLGKRLADYRTRQDNVFTVGMFKWR